MSLFKRTLSALTVLLLLVPLLCLAPAAEGEEGFMFIDGENIARQTNSAVIYTDTENVTLNSRGHDIIIGADGRVIKIHEGTIGADRVLDIPAGGCVISASGVATEWLKANVKVGTALHYDRYTQKLFLCDESGNYNPYFTKQISVTGENGAFSVVSESETLSKYSYSVAADANGVIVARGGGVSSPEGGIVISASTEADRKTLLMYAIVGGSVSVADGIATFGYDSTMLFKTMEIAASDAKSKIERSKSSFADIDFAKADTLVQYIDSVLLAAAEADYYSATSFALALEKEVFDLCSEDNISELRAAFHTPDELTADGVRKTVLAAKNAGLNTIILRTSNSVGTFISLPDSFPFEQDEMFGGFDVLQSYIDICKEENIALTLCIDVYYNEYAAIANESWVAKNDNTAIGDENAAEYGTVFENKYFSPASEGFKEYFLSYVEYIVTHYQINSVMFDYLRYPRFSELTDLGYDDETMTLFSREVKQPIAECFKIRNELFNSPLWEDWVKFRTALVDDMAKAVSETVRSARADVSVLAVAARESVDYYYMQNAVGWVENGIMDGLCLALYEGKAEENDPLPELSYHGGMISEKGRIFSAYTSDDAFLFVGLESAKGYNASAVSSAVAETRSFGADGFIFSSLESYLALNYYSELSENVLKNASVSPFSDTAEAMKTLLEYSKTKISSRIFPAGGCDEAAKSSAEAQIDARLALLSDGALSYEQAVMLESDIAMIFASSPAKAEVLEEFEALTKLALLSKGVSEEIIPPEDMPDASNPVVSGTVSDTASEESVTSDDKSLPEAPEYISDSGESEDGISIGTVLIYIFVGIAAVAAITGVITAARRKETKPVNRHMPKSADERKNDADK